MIEERLKEFIAESRLSVREAMERINLNSKGILYSVDDGGHLQGSLTDGDIRRWIIAGGDLEASIGNVAFREVISSHSLEYDINLELMKKNAIHSVPIVNVRNEIIDIQFDSLEERKTFCINQPQLKGYDAIIMAGGKGTRLYPYTRILPKPLIPIGEKPILELILDRFNASGVENFYITVNYKKEMIKSYLSELGKTYCINYIDEESPLGTAGGISLIQKDFKKPVIISNCDILIEADYKDMIRHHDKCGNDMTIIASLKDMQIPYGVLHSREDGYITSMEEKPKVSYIINTGMYIVNPEYISWIPKDRIYHMTNLAEDLMKDGKKVGMFPISENSFFDMGEFEEMKRMEEHINRRYSN